MPDYVLTHTACLGRAGHSYVTHCSSLLDALERARSAWPQAVRLEVSRASPAQCRQLPRLCLDHQELAP